MPEKIITIALLLICAVRSISYAIFTFKQKNITGGIGILVLPIGAAACAAILMFK